MEGASSATTAASLTFSVTPVRTTLFGHDSQHASSDLQSLCEVVTMYINTAALLFPRSNEIFVLDVATPRQLPNSLPYRIASRVRPKKERVMRVPVAKSLTPAGHAHLPAELRLALNSKGDGR